MSQAFYWLLAVALCITASAAAPQSTNGDTDITYIRAQPEVLNQSVSNNSSRESRIQNIPLTIPDIDKNTNQLYGESNVSVSSNYPDKVNSNTDSVKSNEDITNNSEGKSGENINNNFPNKEIFNDDPRANNGLPDPILEQPNITEIITAESKQTDTISDALGGFNQTDHLASESRQVDSQINDATPSYDDARAVTDDDVPEEVTVNTEVVEETTKASAPEFIPKLSHHGKSTFGSHPGNLIGRSGERRFRSKCKCVKIWNCTKLQITVPRCPEEFFLCCS